MQIIFRTIEKKIWKKRNHIHSFQSFIGIAFVKIKFFLSASQLKEVFLKRKLLILYNSTAKWFRIQQIHVFLNKWTFLLWVLWKSPPSKASKDCVSTGEDVLEVLVEVGSGSQNIIRIIWSCILQCILYLHSYFIEIKEKNCVKIKIILFCSSYNNIYIYSVLFPLFLMKTYS